MSPRLVEGASGLRHLRFAREVLGTLEAHLREDLLLGGVDRDDLEGAARALEAHIDALSAAVKSYRDFLERVRTKARGGLRVAAWIERQHDHGASSVAPRFREDFRTLEERETSPRRAAVRARVAELRSALDAMDAGLGERFGEDFVASLYPAVARDGRSVVDELGDDDASSPS